MMNMAGDESREGFENDIYTFFDYAIKVKAEITDHGIFRKVDQLTFFDRDNGENKMVVFYRDGKLTGEKLPESFLKRFKNEKKLLRLYKTYVLNEELTPKEREEQRIEEETSKNGSNISEFINLQETEQIDPNKLFANSDEKNDDVVVLAKEKNDNIQLFDIYGDI